MTLYEQLMEAARSLDEMPPPEAPEWKSHTGNGHPTGDRPGDQFNAKATWPEILSPHGWTFLYNRGGLDHWRRPGKSVPGISATTGVRPDCGKDLLYVFTSNGAPLDPEQSYSKFSAYVLLNHDGDYGAAARALMEKGYGDKSLPLGRLVLDKEKKKAPRPNADNSSDPLDQDATAHDLVLHQATIRWAWEKWLPVGVLTILASEPGCGKTRLCMDLAKRIYLGLPWPDGSPPSFGLETPTLWVPADNQHPEIGTIPSQFGFPTTSVYLNATRRNPFTGTMLDAAEDLAEFEARIKRIRPGLVFVDTCLNATDRTSHKPEDAKAFFKPLQEIAARQQIVLVCVTHLNASGKPLGRRIEGQGRVVVMLEHPDPDKEPNRRKLWVKKSNSLFPEALGVTMTGAGNEYDDKPPEKPEDGKAGAQISPAIQKAIDWLSDWISAGPRRVSITIDSAETVGISKGAIYRAKDHLRLSEYISEGKKWWELTSNKD